MSIFDLPVLLRVSWILLVAYFSVLGGRGQHFCFVRPICRSFVETFTLSNSPIMVHGGGHHHHSSNNGGTSSRGSSSTTHQSHNYQAPVILNNQYGSNIYNQDPFWWSNTKIRRQRQVSHVSSHSGSEDDEEACRECGRSCCCAGCVCAVCCREELLHPSKSTCMPNFCLVFLLFIALVTVSSVNDTFVLDAGETRRIHRRFLTRNLRISSTSLDGLPTVVYDIKTKCPALTGPSVVLEKTMNITLHDRDYQFDYFYLNDGSNINLDIKTLHGALNIYILKSGHVLDRLLGDSGEDESAFFRIAVQRKFTFEGQEASISYRTRDHSGDYYILLYDNASGETNFTMHYKVAHSSYDLENHKPICEDTEVDCFIPQGNIGSRCILVEAGADKMTEKDQSVTIYLEADRAWLQIAVICVLPLLFCWYQQRRALARRSYEEIPGNPPAYAPVEATAPFEPTDLSQP